VHGIDRRIPREAARRGARRTARDDRAGLEIDRHEIARASKRDVRAMRRIADDAARLVAASKSDVEPNEHGFVGHAKHMDAVGLGDRSDDPRRGLPRRDDRERPARDRRRGHARGRGLASEDDRIRLRSGRVGRAGGGRENREKAQKPRCFAHAVILQPRVDFLMCRKS
jgi:hypothetical protein